MLHDRLRLSVSCPHPWEGLVMSFEATIGMFGFVYLKSPCEINVECELGGTETGNKGTN